MSKKIHPYQKKLTIYCNDVISGKVVACQKHVWACERFLSDLRRVKGDPSFGYVFDGAKAEQFSKWCGIFKHRKGILAGKHIELAPITHFIAGNIYGWYKTKDGFRRFSKMYWQVARKNAKSQLLSLMASYELFVFSGDEVAEVYCAATKSEQAKIVYEETCEMVKGCGELVDGVHFTHKNGRLNRVKNGAFMRPLSKDDKKKADGYSPQFSSIDEYHAHETSEIYDILDSGLMARPQPLIAIITTAGFELNNPCYRVEYDVVTKILDPNIAINIESYFVMINEIERNNSDQSITIDGNEIKPGELIDDIKDPSVWPKANPIVCSYDTGIERIQARLDLALESPEKMRDFMTKTMNVWMNERAFGYMDMAKWGKCQVEEVEFDRLIEKNTNKTCYVGLDLSAKIDLTSATFEFIGKDDKYYVFSHSFMPSDMFHTKMKVDQVPYDLWERKGWLTVTEGGVVDYRAVKKWILDTCEERGWRIEEVCIDPWGATQLSSDLADDGVVVVEIRQGFTTLSEPTKDVRYMVYSDRVVHAENHLLTWAIGNTVTRANYNQCLMLDKEKAKQRIDPAAALMNAHTRAMVCAESGSVYEKRGMREL